MCWLKVISRKNKNIPINTGRMALVIATGIRAKPGEAMTVAGPAVNTPGGRIMTGRKLGLVLTGWPAMLMLGAAPREGVLSTKPPADETAEDETTILLLEGL